MAARRASDATLRVAIWVLALVATIFDAEIGKACSCGDITDPLDVDVILQGEAVEVHQPLHLRFIPRGRGLEREAWRLWYSVATNFDSDVRTVVRVNTVWKGRAPKFVTINTGSGLCSYGAVFQEGRDYVVHATRDNGELHLYSCAGGRVFSGKALEPEYAAKLGPGIPPQSGARGFPKFWRHLLFPATLALPIALAGLIYLIAKSRHKRAFDLGVG